MGLESHTWKMSYTSTAFKNIRLNEIIKKGRTIKRKRLKMGRVRILD